MEKSSQLVFPDVVLRWIRVKLSRQPISKMNCVRHTAVNSLLDGEHQSGASLDRSGFPEYELGHENLPSILIFFSSISEEQIGSGDWKGFKEGRVASDFWQSKGNPIFRKHNVGRHPKSAPRHSKLSPELIFPAVTRLGSRTRKRARNPVDHRTTTPWNEFNAINRGGKKATKHKLCCGWNVQ